MYPFNLYIQRLQHMRAAKSGCIMHRAALVKSSAPGKKQAHEVQARKRPSIHNTVAHFYFRIRSSCIHMNVGKVETHRVGRKQRKERS
jgi:hypothetical protein